MDGSARLSTGNVANGLYLDILNGIIAGEYPPKSTLPTETRLANDYGVSRAVVRSALDLLKSQGVVRAFQGSGTVVRAHDPDALDALNEKKRLADLHDCYACRLAIEPDIAALLARDITQETTDFLNNNKEIIERSQNGRHPRIGYDRTVFDVEFHIGLSELSGNPFFISIMNSMRPHIMFGINIELRLPRADRTQHAKFVGDEHLQVVNAILSGDPDAARTEMHKHIENAINRIL